MPTPEEEAAQKAADETKAKEEAAKPQGKTFTQVELDAIIKDRLDREKEAQKKENEKVAQKAKEEEATKNGEWQKLAEEREQKVTKAEQEAITARAELATERTKNATIAAASKAEYGADGKMKFRTPELAYKLAKLETPDLTPETVADALKEIAKAYPEMLEGATAQQNNNNPSPVKGKAPKTSAPDLSKAPRQVY